MNNYVSCNTSLLLPFLIEADCVLLAIFGSSWIVCPLKGGWTGCPETSVTKCPRCVTSQKSECLYIVCGVGMEKDETADDPVTATEHDLVKPTTALRLCVTDYDGL
jgi:hypothetical protein